MEVKKRKIPERRCVGCGETKEKKPWRESVDDCLDHLMSILLCLFAVTEIVVLASLLVALLLAIFGII